MRSTLASVALASLSWVLPACGRGDGGGATDAPLGLVVMGADEVRALAAAEGKPVLASLWATWCAPCVAEMAALTRFQAAHPDVVVLGLATDDPSQPRVLARLERVLTSAAPGYRQARIRPGGEDRLLRAFGRAWDGTLPKLVLVGPGGEARLVLEQAVDDALLQRLVVPRLGEARP